MEKAVSYSRIQNECNFFLLCLTSLICPNVEESTKLFKELVYFLIWFILNVLNRILIAYHLLCLSRYLSSYLIANAHNDFAENFHFSNSSLSTVAPSIVLYPAELENRYKLSVGKVFSFSLYLHCVLK